MKYTGLQQHIRWCIEFSWPLWHFICGCKNLGYCVCVCLSGVIVIWRWYLGHLWKYFGITIHQVTGCPCHGWGERMSLSLGESRVSCQAHGHTFHSLVCLKMKISAGENLGTLSFLQVWIWIMFFFRSIKATTTKTSKQTKESSQKLPKTLRNFLVQWVYCVDNSPKIKYKGKNSIKEQAGNGEFWKHKNCCYIPFAKKLNKENKTTFFLFALRFWLAKMQKQTPKSFFLLEWEVKRRFITPYYLYDFL